MAGKLKISLDTSQPGIATYIQKQRSNSVKRALSSPTKDQPSKKSNMEVTQGSNAECDSRLKDLPPELKLLYDTLNVRLLSIESKIDPNVAT